MPTSDHNPLSAPERFNDSLAAPATPLPDGAIEACFEAASAGMVIASPEGRVLRANAAFGRMLGVTPASLIGRAATELTHQDDRAETRRLLSELVTGRRPQANWEKRYLRSDGTTVWAQVTATAIHGRDGQARYQVLTVEDRTAVRALLQQLEATSLRYSRLVGANVIGVTVATERGVEEANDEMLRLTGTPRGDFEAYGLDWQAITPPEYLPKDFAGLQEIVGRGACTPFEKELIWPDGTRVPILVGGALLDREPLRWIAFALDLTERKRGEADRERLLAEAQLARNVAERALAARDTLLARIAHDMRSPLAATRGYASIMRDGIPAPLPAEHRETVQRLIATQDHLMALIDELLAFARGGEPPHTLEPLDVDAVLETIEPLIAPQARAAGVTYRCPGCAALLAIRADRLQVTEILVNLVGNAIKFTPPGGQVTVAAVGADAAVHLTVTDTGIGIPTDELARIFEPFVQSSASPPDRADVIERRGYGLGLAISRDLARGLGGDLTVRSTPGHGTTLTLELPHA